MMEVVVTTGAISRAKLQSNHHHQQTNIQFLTDRMPFLSPNQQCQSTGEKMSHSNIWFRDVIGKLPYHADGLAGAGNLGYHKNGSL